MKRLLVNLCLAALCAAMPLSAWSKPAKPGLLTRLQPDGTTVQYRIVGDERGHVLLSEDGYVLADIDNALYYANVLDNGTLTTSGILAKPLELRQVADIEFLSQIDSQKNRSLLQSMRQRKIMREISDKDLLDDDTDDDADIDSIDSDSVDMHIGKFSDSHFPAFGEVRSLVVLVEYTDVPFTLEDPYDYFYRMYNEEGFSDNDGTGSARDYFIENSKGQFAPQFDVYGPLVLSHKRSYYGGNDWAGNDKNPEKMAIEACQQLDSIVDFNIYDTDHDGFIDNIYIVYAGDGEASGGVANTVWPHAWQVTEATGTPYYFDDVRLDRYACGNEWETDGPDGVGTLIHEFSHVLGLPDLYSINYTGAFTPGSWSVLDAGSYNNDGHTPPLYSIFERNAMGWTTPECLPDSGLCALPQISEHDGYMVRTSKNHEFFLLENRQLSSWDTFLPGHGMLVWHIDYNESAWYNNTVNDNGSHQYVNIIEADNRLSEFTRSGDAFPGTSNVTSFSPDTKPAFVTWKKESTGYALTCIEENDSIITFIVNEPKEDPGDDPADDPGDDPSDDPGDNPGDDPSEGDDPSALQAISDNKAETSVQYFTLTGIPCQAPSAGIYLRVATYADGSSSAKMVSIN